MTKRRMMKLSADFRNALVNDTVPFWLNHATNREHGGYTNFLDRAGSVLCPDKPLWIQGRVGWTWRGCTTHWSRDRVARSPKNAVDFITAHGFDTDGGSSLGDAGRLPAAERRYLFAEIFAIMAYAEYGAAAGDRASWRRPKAS
jgi:N-acylglucosamine 2-epimerase